MIGNTIKKTINNKSPGVDGIPPKLLKEIERANWYTVITLIILYQEILVLTEDGQ